MIHCWCLNKISHSFQLNIYYLWKLKFFKDKLLKSISTYWKRGKNLPYALVWTSPWHDIWVDAFENPMSRIVAHKFVDRTEIDEHPSDNGHLPAKWTCVPMRMRSITQMTTSLSMFWLTNGHCTVTIVFKDCRQ